MADGLALRVLLVTCSDLADGEPGGNLLPPALAERGIAAEWVCWDDPAVDWSAADLVAVRSTWDYTERLAEFLAWARSVPRLLNGVGVFAWNADKRYLATLPDLDLPVVPTLGAAGPEELTDAVTTTLRHSPRAVVKPAVGAGGRGLHVCSSPDDVDPAWATRPVVVQPLLESVSSFGERSVFVLGGRAGLGVVKRPQPGEVRVHEEFGGATVPEQPTPEAAGLAERAVAVAAAALSARIDYARVDLMQDDDGREVVGELELIEPGLYLDVLPENADRFAALVSDLLTG